MEIHESDESGRIRRRLRQVPVKQKDGRKGYRFVAVENPTVSVSQRLIDLMRDIFLPTGYPQSVSPDYTEYQIYDSAQAFASTIARLLAARATLQALGFADASATTTSAVLVSTLRSTLSRFARILFAYRFSTDFGPECKKYRFLADILNDAALFLDCLAPFFIDELTVALPFGSFLRCYYNSIGPGFVWNKPSRAVEKHAPILYSYGYHLRVLMLCASSVLTTLCGVAADSSKTNLSIHFARQNNVAELQAKDSSQETVIELMATLFGSWFITKVQSSLAVWISLCLLVLLHLWTNYHAVRAVVLTTLNRHRACLLFSVWAETGEILTPEAVAREERLFFFEDRLLWLGEDDMGWAIVGDSVSTSLLDQQKLSTLFSSGVSRGDANRFLSASGKADRFLVQATTWQIGSYTDNKVSIFANQYTEEKGLLEAWCQSLVGVRKLFLERKADEAAETRHKTGKKLATSAKKDSVYGDSPILNAKWSVDWYENDFLERAREAGWNVDVGLEAAIGCRILSGSSKQD